MPAPDQDSPYLLTRERRRAVRTRGRLEGRARHGPRRPGPHADRPARPATVRDRATGRGQHPGRPRTVPADPADAPPPPPVDHDRPRVWRVRRRRLWVSTAVSQVCTPGRRPMRTLRTATPAARPDRDRPELAVAAAADPALDDELHRTGLSTGPTLPSRVGSVLAQTGQPASGPWFAGPVRARPGTAAGTEQHAGSAGEPDTAVAAPGPVRSTTSACCRRTSRPPLPGRRAGTRHRLPKIPTPPTGGWPCCDDCMPCTRPVIWKGHCWVSDPPNSLRRAARPGRPGTGQLPCRPCSVATSATGLSRRMPRARAGFDRPRDINLTAKVEAPLLLASSLCLRFHRA